MSTKDIIAVVVTVIFAVACGYALWASRNDEPPKPGE